MAISSTSSPSASSSVADKPASTSAASKPAESTPAAKPAESTSADKPASEPNMAAEAERFESTPSSLASGEAAQSDPESSAHFTGVQSETAHDVTGDPVETESPEASEEASETPEAGETQTPEPVETPAETAETAEIPEALPEDVVQFNALMDQIQNVREGHGTEGLEPSSEIQWLEYQANGLSGPAQAEFNQTMGEMKESFEDLRVQADFNKTFRDTTATAMDASESAKFEEFAQQKLDELAPDFQEASANFFETLKDPMVQASVAHGEPFQTQEFVSNVAKYGGYSESGLEYLGGLNDDLATLGEGGTPQSPVAQAILDARGRLSDSDRAKLDANLGIITGIDQAVRPEGATERLESVGEALGLTPDQVAAVRQPATPGEEAGTGELITKFGDFVNGANGSFNVFQAVTNKVEEEPLEVGHHVMEGAEKGSEFLLKVLPKVEEGAELGKVGRLLGTTTEVLEGVAKFASRAAPLLEAGGIAMQLAEGNYVGAGGGAMGLAGGLLMGSNPEIGIPLVAGSALVAGYQAVEGQAAYANFRTEAIQASVGDPFTDPYAAVLFGANAGNLSTIPDLAPPGEQRKQQLQSLMPPGADAGALQTYFWETQYNRLLAGQ